MIFDFVSKAADRFGIPAGLVPMLHLAVEETFVNLVRYNTDSDNDVTIRLERDGRELRIALIDRDVQRYDPTSRDPVDVAQPLRQRKPGGLGVHFIREIMDDMTYEYSNRTATITLIKHLEA